MNMSGVQQIRLFLGQAATCLVPTTPMPCVSLKLLASIYDVFVAMEEFKICKCVLSSPFPCNFLIFIYLINIS